MADSCATCFFFASQTFTDDAANVIVQGGCHRVAPITGDGIRQAKWPLVQVTDWCGEFSGQDPNVYNATLLDQTPWSPYTPTITATVGVLTAASATGFYKVFGKICHFRAVIDITTNGTGATLLALSLPFQVRAGSNATVGVGHGTAGVNLLRAHTGFMGGAVGQTALIALYDGTYPGANGVQIVFSGVFEVA